MRSFEILLSIFAVVVIALGSLLFTCKSPALIQYEHVTHDLMQAENLDSESELSSRYPELNTIKDNLEQLKNLHLQLEILCGGPAPQMGRQDAEKVRQICRDVKRLRMKNQKILKALTRAAAEKQLSSST